MTTTDAIVTVAKSGLDAKVEDAKAYLGDHWVLHPAYTSDPRHSLHEAIYVPARQQYLHAISRAAEIDRSGNPAFQRAEQFRSVFSN